MRLWLAIAAGGALGAVSRFYLTAWISRLYAGSFPVGIITVNMIGSILMGLIIALTSYKLNISPALKTMITTGFLGAFTTFSTFSMEAFMLFQRGVYGQAVLYVLVSVALGLLGFVIGYQLGKIL